MSMSTIRMRDILALIAVVAIVLAMIPTIVLTSLVGATDNGTIIVDFQTGDSPPTVNSVTLYDNATTTPETTMTPLVEYVVRVNVTEGLTLDNLTTVTAWLYYSDNSTFAWPGYTDTNINSQTIAKFTWTKGSGFAMASNGTWELVASDCQAPPDLGQSTGNFDFHFKPGKVAHESTSDTHEWRIYALASNGTDTVSNHQTGLEMNWYGEISVAGTVHIGSVSPGQNDKQSDVFGNTYIANGTYTRAVSAATSWTGPRTLSLVTGAPGASQFALEANETSGTSGATVVSGSYASLGSSHGITGDAGDLISTNYLFLSLGSTGVPSGTYSGNVYYEIHS